MYPWSTKRILFNMVNNQSSNTFLSLSNELSLRDKCKVQLITLIKMNWCIPYNISERKKMDTMNLRVKYTALERANLQLKTCNYECEYAKDYYGILQINLCLPFFISFSYLYCLREGWLKETLDGSIFAFPFFIFI